MCDVYRLKDRVEVARKEIKETSALGQKGGLPSGDGNLSSAGSSIGSF